MATPSRHTPSDQADSLTNVFANLRRHNAYAARVARLLDAKRERQISRVVQTQRKHRSHQAR
jgi:hypothetical protein